MTGCYPLPPIMTGCYPLHPVMTRCYPLHPVMTGCYPLPPIMTGCYPLHPVMTRCYPLHPVMTGCYPLHPVMNLWLNDIDNPIVSEQFQNTCKANFKMFLYNHFINIQYIWNKLDSTRGLSTCLVDKPVGESTGWQPTLAAGEGNRILFIFVRC